MDAGRYRLGSILTGTGASDGLHVKLERLPLSHRGQRIDDAPVLLGNLRWFRAVFPVGVIEGDGKFSPAKVPLLV